MKFELESPLNWSEYRRLERERNQGLRHLNNSKTHYTYCTCKDPDFEVVYILGTRMYKCNVCGKY